MAQDKYDGYEEAGRERSAEQNEANVRARNRTVMLTPDITGKVRARLSRDLESNGAGDSMNGYSSTEDTGGFATPQIGAALSGLRESEPRKNSPIHRNIPQLPAPEEQEEVESTIPQSKELRASTPQRVPPPIIEEPEEEPPVSGQDRIIWHKTTPIIGFLVSYDLDPNGTVYELRSGRLIVTSELPNSAGNYLYLTDETISPAHAIARITDQGQIQILDQLSEFGTGVIKFDSTDEISLSGDKASVEHGDVLRIGKRIFSVCLVIR